MSSLVDLAERPLVGVGVGAPGLIDTATGTVRWAVGLDWRDVPIGERLTVLTGLPTVVVNDSQAAAMAEWAFGREEGSSTMVVVKVGEGIGAGIVIGGRLFTGDDFGAGEIGHTRVSDAEIRCRCGSTRLPGDRGQPARRSRSSTSAWRPAMPASALAGREITAETLLRAFR